MPQYSHIFVVLMGMGTVFFGLICIILLTSLMGKIVGTSAPATAPAAAPKAATPAPAPVAVSLSAESELVAVITTALAHELDCAPSGLRIMSINKIA